MPRGNEIVVTSNPRGVFVPGYVTSGQTFKPGMIVQRKGSVDLIAGVATFELYNTGADGNRATSGIAIVCGDELQGGDASTQSFADGQHVPKIYYPVTGEELNAMIADVTADGTEDHPIGELLMVDEDSGKLIVTTGTPQSTPFTLLETLTNVAADQLAWVQFNGSP